MEIAIAADHAGYEAKQELLEWLRQNGHTVTDCGCAGKDSVDYPDYGAKVAALVSRGEVPCGILICGTGIGMSIVANKFAGVRAALCDNAFAALATREHNDANILVMGARQIDVAVMKQLARVFLDTKYLGERHQKRLDKIAAIEEENFK